MAKKPKVSAGQRRFARRLWVEHEPPPDWADLDGDGLVNGMSPDELSQFIETMKARPYRRGASRRAK